MQSFEVPVTERTDKEKRSEGRRLDPLSSEARVANGQKTDNGTSVIQINSHNDLIKERIDSQNTLEETDESESLDPK